MGMVEHFLFEEKSVNDSEKKRKLTLLPGEEVSLIGGQEHTTPLSSDEERVLKSHLVSLSSLDVAIQIPGGAFFPLKVSPSPSQLMEVTEGLESQSVESSSVKMTFVLNLSKYLMNCRLITSESGKYFIEAKGEIFLVQRRENFRVNVSAQVVSKVSFKTLHRPERLYQARMVNISLGGCLLEIETGGQNFRIQDLIDLILNIEGGKVMSFKASIRRITLQPGAERPHVHLGIKFESLNSFEKARLNEVVMKCYRIAHRLQR